MSANNNTAVFLPKHGWPSSNIVLQSDNQMEKNYKIKSGDKAHNSDLS